MIFKKALPMIICGAFLFLDRFLKWQALHAWSQSRLLNKYFGWQPFFNPGVAFGIPVPSWLIILLTVPIVVLLTYHVARSTYHVTRSTYQANEPVLRVTCYVLIIAGALSNLIDRVIYGKTVDYILIFTGVINLADILIVAGFLLYLFSRKQMDTNGHEYRANHKSRASIRDS